MRLIAILVMSTTLLAGCGPAELFHFLGGSQTVTVVKVECPQLEDPPDAVVDALTAVKDDPDAEAWIIELSQHYDQLDTCKP